MARDDLQENRGILGRPGQRPYVVLAKTVRQHAAATDQAVGRLQAGDATGGGRTADRAAGVAAEVAGANPAATAAAEPDEEPAGEQVRSQGLRAGGNSTSHDGPPWANSHVAFLPKSTPAGGGELLLATGIPHRDIVRQQLGHGRRPDARGVEDVFQAMGTPCSRLRGREAMIAASAALASARARSGAHRDEAVELAVECFNARRQAR